MCQKFFVCLVTKILILKDSHFMYMYVYYALFHIVVAERGQNGTRHHFSFLNHDLVLIILCKWNFFVCFNPVCLYPNLTSNCSGKVVEIQSIDA